MVGNFGIRKVVLFWIRKQITCVQQDLWQWFICVYDLGLWWNLRILSIWYAALHWAWRAKQKFAVWQATAHRICPNHNSYRNWQRGSAHDNGPFTLWSCKNSSTFASSFRGVRFCPPIYITSPNGVPYVSRPNPPWTSFLFCHLRFRKATLKRPAIQKG